MNLRQRVALVPSVALLISALPMALTAVGLGALPVAERESFAQGAPPASNDGVTEIARQRYQEGVKDFDAGKYEEARAAFLQAYALKRAPAVLLNIALSELRSPVNHADEAGAHFQQFLREATAATPEQRATAEKGIADAKKRAGTIVITVDAIGADVSIDGTSMGKAPIADPVFVKPGKHTVFAQYQGHTAAVVIDVKVGATVPATLTTGVTGAAPGPATSAPSTSTTPGGPGAAGGMGPASGGPAPSSSYPPSSGPGTSGAGPSPGAEQPTSESEPFFHWYKRKPIAWVGTGVAGVGLVMGIVSSITAGTASARSAKHSAQIKDRYDEEHPNEDPKDRPAICSPQNLASAAFAEYVKPCATLQGDIASYKTSVAFAATGWVLFGVGAVGTVVYALVDWKGGKGPPPEASAQRQFAVTPIISPTYHGIGVVGSF